MPPLCPLYPGFFIFSGEHVSTYKRMSSTAGAASSRALLPTTAALARAATSKRMSTIADAASTSAREAACAWPACVSSTANLERDDPALQYSHTLVL